MDITNTKITSNGIQSLQQLRSLEKLWIDSSCIDTDSAKALHNMQLQSVNISGLNGLGRQTHRLLSEFSKLNAQGHHSEGYPIWAVSSPWKHTVAGVVESVAAEIPLDAQQADLLLEELSSRAAPLGGWGPIAPTQQPGLRWSSGPDATQSDQNRNIQSVDEFASEVQNSFYDYWAVRRFGQEFSSNDVPKLLAELRSTPYSNNRELFHLGSFLLVQHGITDQDVQSQLREMLSHNDLNIRGLTLCAFSIGGASPFYEREEWKISQEAEVFIVPRLLQMCDDKSDNNFIRDCARQLLVEIIDGKQKYAETVMPTLINLLNEDGAWHGLPRGNSQRQTHTIALNIRQVAKLDRDVAITSVSRIQEILKQLDQDLADATPPRPVGDPDRFRVLHNQRQSVLEALAITAHHSPTLADQVAIDFIDRMRSGLPIGPFSELLSSETAETNRMVVLELLRNPDAVEGELGYLAKAICGWNTNSDN